MLTITTTPKETTLQLVSKMSDVVTWDELIYRLHVRQKLEVAHREAESGQLLDHEEVFAELLGDEEDT